MPEEKSHERRGRPSRWVMAWAALGAPIAWALHLGARYPFVPVACERSDALILHVITTVSGVGVLLAAVASWRLWACARSKQNHDAREGVRRQRLGYLAAFGIGMSLLFSFVIGAEVLPTLFLDPCMGVELGLEVGA